MKKALVIYAKLPVPGQVKTRLSPPLTREEAADLYLCMLRDTIAKSGRLAGIDRFLHYCGSDQDAPFFVALAEGCICMPQQGADLGKRMAHTFHTLLAKGYDQVAIIGSDSPDLPESYLSRAYLQLDQGADAVMGPSSDGGYYLIAMSRFLPQLFRDIPWSSEKVLGDTLARAEVAGITVALLPEWHDVDRVEDLQRPELLAGDNGAELTGEFLKDWFDGRAI